MIAKMFNLKQPDSPYATLRFTADSRQLLAGNKLLLHPEKQQSILLGTRQNSPVLSMRFNSNGKHLTLKRANGSIQIFNQAGQLQGSISQIGNIQNAVVWLNSPGDRLLVSREAGQFLELYDLQGKRLATMRGSVFYGCSEDMPNINGGSDSWACRGSSNPFSPDGNYFWTIGVRNVYGDVAWNARMPDTVKLWNKDGKLLSEIPVSSLPHTLSIDDELLGQMAVFSPQSDRIVAANSNGEIRVQDLQTQKISEFRVQPGLMGIGFSADGSSLIVTYPPLPQIINAAPLPESPLSTVGTIVRVWNLQGQQLTQFELNSSLTGFPNDNSPDGVDWQTKNSVKTLLSSVQQLREHPVQLIPGEWLQTIVAKNPMNLLPSDIPGLDRIADLQFSAAGDRIATRLPDGRIDVWDDQGNAIAQYQGNAMALSPDGKSIVVASAQDNLPRLWRIEDASGLIQRGCDWLNLYAASSFELTSLCQTEATGS